MYEYYNNNKQIVKNTFYSKLLVSPNILKVAREHFNCPTLTSVPLDDEGHHFDELFLANELMTPSQIGNNVYTKFS